MTIVRKTLARPISAWLQAIVVAAVVVILACGIIAASVFYFMLRNNRSAEAKFAEEIAGMDERAVGFASSLGDDSGAVIFDGRVDLADEPRFALQCRLEDGDLSQISRELGPQCTSRGYESEKGTQTRSTGQSRIAQRHETDSRCAR